MLALSQISYGSILLAGMARLPMVAGWDSLLPAWFTKLHPKYHTPVNSVIFVGIITLVVGVVSIIGVGEQEAFQLLVSASFIFYAITYLVMFAVQLFGLKQLRHSAERPSWRLRLAAVLGGLVSMAFIVLSLFPIVDVANPLLFGGKILAVMLVTNLVGVVIYRVATRRS
jgi:amino acid transporter